MTDETTSDGQHSMATGPQEAHASEEKNERKSQAKLLVETAAGVELFRSTTGVSYGTVPHRGHRETYAVESATFRDWLVGRFYSKFGRPPHESAVKSAIAVLAAKARHGGKTADVSVRVGGADDVVFIDLADDEWRALQIDGSGVQVLPPGQVKFRRPNGMLPLPRPAAAGSVEELKGFVNVKDDEQFVLLIGFLLGALNPRGPYPILEITGEQGSAKSTLSKVIRQLIDPNTAPARAAIINERDLMIAATNGWLLVFDNLSKLSAEMSDALCRISTGGAFSVRKLYENDEEMLFEAQRPIVINGIEDLAYRPDMLERSIVLDLPLLPPDKRRDEREFWNAFDEARPRILAALYSGVRAAIANRGNLYSRDWPRMADFAKWVTAAEPALGWESGTFLRAYSVNRREANVRVLEKNGIAEALVELAEQGWDGTATDLLRLLGESAVQGLPRGANQLSGELRRLAPALRLLGVSVQFERRGHQSTKLIVIRKLDKVIDRTDRIDRTDTLAAA